MDIYLAAERVFHFIPQYSLEVARDRLEQKKTSLVAGTLGSLISRPNPEDIKPLSVEKRLEPFWHINVNARTTYDRNHTYTIPVSSPEVQRVTALGKDLSIIPSSEGEAVIQLDAEEHCIQEQRATYTFDGMGNKEDLSKYLSYAKKEISDLDKFEPEDMLLVPPQAQATTVVRTVIAEVIKPVQAQVIHEERVDVEALELYFRPVYAMEYEWVTKGKRAVLELDALTGETRSGGKKLGDQLKSMVNRELIFDITADAVGTVVPGGSIAVKLFQAVVDRKK